MSVALMTLFAVSILGALGMAVYGLRVLVGRWEQPRRLRQQAVLPVPGPAPVTLARPVPVPAPAPVQATSVTHPAPPSPVWIAPTGSAPAQVAGIVSDAPRLARGSIPPDFSGDEPDTDPGIPELPQPEPVVMRGARYSVIRSSRR